MKRFVVLAFVAALTTSGCTLGERTRYATLLVNSPARAAAAGTATGTMTFDMAVAPVGESGSGLPGGGAFGNITPPPPGELPIVIDFGNQTASVSLPNAEGSEPIIVLAGTRVFVRRGSTSGISSRRWVVLDFAKLEEVTPPEPGDLAPNTGLALVAFPGPLQLVEMLAGSLTGSTKLAGPETYAANLSREKADRELELDDRERELRANTLRLVAVTDEVHPAQITLDTEGRPTSVDVRLRPRLRADLDIEVRVRTQLTYRAATVTIPSPDDSLVLETEGQLLAEFINLSDALASAAADGDVAP